MAKKFDAQVESIVTATKERMNAVVRDSVQQVIDDAQTPVTKGGRMRVDIGFLRASGQASLEGMPSGPTRPDDGFPKNDVDLIVANFEVGKTLWFGWTAHYAKYREAKDAFLGIAVQNWQQYVNNSVKKLKKAIKSS